jgi:tetratricopeptide (TPR) repeat protein
MLRVACRSRVYPAKPTLIHPVSPIVVRLARYASPPPQHSSDQLQFRSDSPSPLRPTAAELESFQNQQENYARPTAFAFSVFHKIIKYSIGGIAIMAGVTALGLEATHQWVEHIELQPELKGDPFGWESERDRWTGGPQGGTDSRLGWWARRAVRSAWIPLNWGSDNFESIIGVGEGEEGGLNIFERKYAVAETFLRGAIEAAQKRISEPSDHALLELTNLHAAVVERMGGRANLEAARTEWESLLSLLPAHGNETARIAKRLGDLNARLGNITLAIDAWNRSLDATGFTQQGRLPSEPSSQRTTISTLLSISGNYALQRELQLAKQTEETALSMLEPLPIPSLTRITKDTAPEQLHRLFTYHRSALFMIHLAEVMWAQSSRKNLTTSLDYLAKAAEKSEHTALLLTGTPRVHPDAPLSAIPHPPVPNANLLTVFGSSKTLGQPARSLLRDARRSAAEAWNLRGLLLEGGKGDKEALECFERALEWAGGQNNIEGEGDVLERYRKQIWRNWTRLRERVLVSKSQ